LFGQFGPAAWAVSLPSFLRKLTLTHLNPGRLYLRVVVSETEPTRDSFHIGGFFLESPRQESHPLKAYLEGRGTAKDKQKTLKQIPIMEDFGKDIH